MAAQQRDRNGSGAGENNDRRERRSGRGNDRDNRRNNENKNEYIERVVTINRVSKVVKGGRRFSFTALVVVGDGEGTVGVGYGKAKEVPQAISKGVEEAKKNFFRVPMIRRTITHVVQGRDTAGIVLLRPAAPGTGVIAGGPVRAVLEAAGVHDVLTKSLGSSNAINIVHATVDALKQLEQPEAVAARRGLPLERVAPASMLRARAEGEAEKRAAAEAAEADKAAAAPTRPSEHAEEPATAPTSTSASHAAPTNKVTTSTFRSHPSVFSAPTEAREPAQAAPASSVSAPTTEDAVAREREFILAWTGGDEETLAAMTDERTTRIWPGGAATTTLAGPSPASPAIGRIDAHDLGGAFLTRYRVRWEGGASLESSVWAPATSGEARLIMVHHQSTLIS